VETITIRNAESESADNALASIENINQALTDTLSDSRGIIGEICRNLLKAGGKRIRPLLTIHSGLIFGGPTRDLLDAALAMELVHMASLIHDDIIDESSLRRNQPSVNRLWGNQAAVLGGDYLFAKAFSVLAEKNLIFNLNLTVQAIQAMCEGEINQAAEKFKLDLTKEEYVERIVQKTAVLLQCSCKSGAFIGAATQTQIEQIGGYGLNLGIAFQIVDDILDFLGDSAVMGKPKHEDLTQGNLTLPAFLLLEHPQHGPWFKDLIGRKRFSMEELAQVDKILAGTGMIQKSFAIANSYIEKAKQCLAGLPDNSERATLMEMADKLKKRTC
jgi:heptaprenyl diphosphate synthase